MDRQRDSQIASITSQHRTPLWGLSRDDWLAYERDMDNQDGYERRIMEMEGEASDAGKLTADLITSITPC